MRKQYCSTLSVGGGTIKCADQLLPCPAPATTELLKGVPIVGGPVEQYDDFLRPQHVHVLLVDFAELHGVHAEFRGEFVNHRLDAENALRMPRRAHRTRTPAVQQDFRVGAHEVAESIQERIFHVAAAFFKTDDLTEWMRPPRIFPSLPAAIFMYWIEPGVVPRVEALLLVVQHIFARTLIFLRHLRGERPLA